MTFTSQVKVEVPSVLQQKLGADGVAALTQMMADFWWEMQEPSSSEASSTPGDRLDRVEAILEKVVESQQRAEKRMDRLEATMAESQQRAEERLDRVEAALERLAESQHRTEERMDRVEAAVERLAEAQQRTEEQVAALVIAQRRTEKGMRKLTEGMDALRRQVGALSENVGFGLEGIARIVLPGYLERHLDVKVLGPLGEELNPRILGPEGEEGEFDLYGVGLRDGKETIIVGEVKSRIYSDDVGRFLRRVEKVGPALPEERLPVLFGYNIHPQAREEAEEAGLLLVAAYQR